MTEAHLPHPLTEALSSIEPEAGILQVGLAKTLDRESSGERIARLKESNYRQFSTGVRYKARYRNADVESIAPERMSTEETEKVLLEHSDNLIGILDGTIPADPSGNIPEFMDGSRRSQELPSEVVYLDKSMRPAAKIVAGLWDYLSHSAKPGSSFINIDKYEYLKYMNYDEHEVNFEDIPQDDISLDLIPQELRRQLVDELRAIYVLNAIDIDESDLSSVRSLPTKFTNKTAALVDEVKSSGSTLRIANLLFSEAFPDAQFEPVYWSVPGKISWRAEDRATHKMTRQFAMNWVPPWYVKETNTGRGIGPKDPSYSSQSVNIRQRVGARYLGTPWHDAENNRLPMDQRSLDFMHDIQMLIERFDKGLASYMPSRSRSDEQIFSLIADYYNVPEEDLQGQEWFEKLQDKRRAELAARSQSS